MNVKAKEFITMSSGWNKQKMPKTVCWWFIVAKLGQKTAIFQRTTYILRIPQGFHSPSTSFPTVHNQGYLQSNDKIHHRFNRFLHELHHFYSMIVDAALLAVQCRKAHQRHKSPRMTPFCTAIVEQTTKNATYVDSPLGCIGQHRLIHQRWFFKQICASWTFPPRLWGNLAKTQ